MSGFKITADSLDMSAMSDKEAKNLVNILSVEPNDAIIDRDFGFGRAVRDVLKIMRDVGVLRLTKHNRADLIARAAFMGHILSDQAVEFLVGVRFKDGLRNTHWRDFLLLEAKVMYQMALSRAGGPHLQTWVVDDGDGDVGNHPLRFAQHEAAEKYAVVYGMKDLDPQMTGYVVLSWGVDVQVYAFHDSGVDSIFQVASRDETIEVVKKLAEPGAPKLIDVPPEGEEE